MTIQKALYLSGPMTGIEDDNYPAFHTAAGKLRAAGYWVVNPAEAYGGYQGLPFSTYMRLDLQRVLEDCDTIVVLPGWERSPGAVLEVAVGAALGHGIVAYHESTTDDTWSLSSVFPLHDTDRERLSYVLGLSDAKADETDLTPEEAAKWPALASVIGRPQIVTVSPAGPEPMSTWSEADNGLLKAADGIVNGDRQRTYGHPINHHTTTSELWQSYLRRANGGLELNVRPQDVSILMVLDKVSRIGGGDKVDNVLDIAGYAQVHAKVRAAQTAPAYEGIIAGGLLDPNATAHIEVTA